MILTVPPNDLAEITEGLAGMAPWMHPFQLAPNTFVGYFKYHDIAETFCTPDSSPQLQTRMSEAFAAYMGGEPFGIIDKALIAGKIDVADSTFLDIASATGKFSMRVALSGAKSVLGVEIRPEQVAQANLLVRADTRLRNLPVRFEHDSLSADEPEFRKGESYDVVLSMGLLYHLANPLQHIRNVGRLAKKVVVLQTLTRFHHDGWEPHWETPAWMTNGAQGVGWTPDIFGPANVLRDEGFAVTLAMHPLVATIQTRWKQAAHLPPALRRIVHKATDRRLPWLLSVYQNPAYLTWVGVRNR